MARQVDKHLDSRGIVVVTIEQEAQMGEYHDMAMDTLREAERAGIRTVSGHHMREPETIFTTCTTCGGKIGWIECPTGGWWSHEVHPADEHDAVPTSKWDCPPCMDQGCDFCNDEDPRRGTDGEGNRDWKLDR